MMDLPEKIREKVKQLFEQKFLMHTIVRIKENPSFLDDPGAEEVPDKYIGGDVSWKITDYEPESNTYHITLLDSEVPGEYSIWVPEEDIERMHPLSEQPEDIKKTINEFLPSVKDKNIKQVKMLIDQGADVNVKDEYGDTLLHRAAYHGHTGIVKLLISKGADVNAKSDAGWTPLHSAVDEGYINIIKLLISAGANVNVRNKDGDTSLHFAAYQGYKDIVKLLISAGADVNVKTGVGDTPLHWTALGGHKDIVKLLISAGADVNARDETGWTPLHLAIEKGRMDTVELLKQYGAKE